MTQVTNVNSEFKWYMIGLSCIAAALMMPAIISMMGPDDISQRIAACMTQPGMQYVDDNCIPIGYEIDE